MHVLVNDKPERPEGQLKATVMGRKAIHGITVRRNAKTVTVRIPALRGGGLNDVKRKLNRDYAA